LIVLGVLLGVLMGIAALLTMVLLAGALVAGLFTVAPHLESSWLNVQITVGKWRMPDKTWTEEQPFRVALCVSPLRKPSYLVGLVRERGVHRIAWSNDKAHARVVEDKLALRSWLWTLEERHGLNVFVCVPPERRS